MSDVLNIANSLERAKARFIDSLTPQLDAEFLLTHVLNVSIAYLYTYPEQELTNEQNLQLEKLIDKRAQGFPIAYLLGHQGFWELDLLVKEGVLIPRPETELLVEIILRLFADEQARVIADLGTGTGAIALAVASEKPNWRIVAVDNSEVAIELAQQNVKELNISNVAIVFADFCKALPENNYDLIVSNPPYIAENDSHLRKGDVRFEPKAALVAGIDGLDAIRKIVGTAKKYLKKGGYLLLEHGYEQKNQVQKILLANDFQNIITEKDLAGHDRATYGSL